jgi:LysR family transcriptional regulator, hydrogen peroxide-inducible genes activator
VDLPQIRYFLAICEARGFTRAAAICGVSQPSLSRAIRRLEQELGGALFDRGPPVRLSPLGQAVQPHFQMIALTIDEIRRIGAGLCKDGAGPEIAKTKMHVVY